MRKLLLILFAFIINFTVINCDNPVTSTQSQNMTANRANSIAIDAQGDKQQISSLIEIKNFQDFKNYFYQNWMNKRDFERNIYIGGAISWTHSHERAYSTGGDYYAPSNFVPSIYAGIGRKFTDFLYLGLDFTFDIYKYTYQNSNNGIYYDTLGNQHFHNPTTLSNVFAFRVIAGINPKNSYIMPYIALGFSSGTASICLSDVYNNPNLNYSTGQIFGLQAGIGIDVLLHKNISMRLELAYNYFFFYDNQINSSAYPYQKLQYIDLTTVRLGFAYKF